MKKHDCAQIEQVLLAGVQGKLSGGLLLDLQAHLTTCPRCQSDYAELLLMRQLVAGSMELLPGPPDALWMELQSNIHKQSEADLLQSILKLMGTLGVPAWGINPVINALALAREADTQKLQARLLGLAIAGLS